MIIPEYWLETVNEKIKIIKEKKEIIGKDCVTFAFITDFHLRVNEKHSVPIIKKVMAECDIPYLLNAGDIVSGVGNCSEEFLLNEISRVFALFKSIENKCLYAEGNHDRAFCSFPPPEYYCENLSKKVFFDKFYLPQKKYSDRIFGDGGYYYLDDKENDVRYVILNSQDVPGDDKTKDGYAIYNSMTHFGFLQSQIEWLCAVALNLPSDKWRVIICSHATPFGVGLEENVYNYDILLCVLDAYNKKIKFTGQEKHVNPLFDALISVDFSCAKGNVMLWVGGHTHRDAVNEKRGIVCVESLSDAAYTEINPERKNTTEEQVLDVFLIDKKNRKANIVRIGRGENREFTFK